MKRRLTSWLSAAVDLILPRVCVVCGERLLRAERHICLDCLADMPLTRFWTMAHNPMADRLNSVIQKGLEDNRAESSGRERYVYAAALFIYSEGNGYRNIPQQVKYHRNVRLGRHFGKMLGRKLKESPMFRDVDMVIPVPLHRIRRWKRGYNQAEVLAEGVADELGVKVESRVLTRRKRTKTQTKLGVEDKALNVKGAFRAVPLNDTDNVRHILLIDDVFTTGSTIGECFSALRELFPPSVRISAVTLGFTGEI